MDLFKTAPRIEGKACEQLLQIYKDKKSDIVKETNTMERRIKSLGIIQKRLDSMHDDLGREWSAKKAQEINEYAKKHEDELGEIGYLNEKVIGLKDIINTHQPEYLKDKYIEKIDALARSKEYKKMDDKGKQKAMDDVLKEFKNHEGWKSLVPKE